MAFSLKSCVFPVNPLAPRLQPPLPPRQAHPHIVPFLSPTVRRISQRNRPSPSPPNLSLAPRAEGPGSLKSRLTAGEQLYGIFIMSFSPTLAEIAGFCGYDYAVVDLEHGSGDVFAALPVLRALEATGVPAVIRLPELDATWAKRALDLGPQGIMFPMIDSPKDARRAVSYCRYPPRGVRGAAHPVVRASRYGIDDDYLSRCEEELLVMCQIETEDAVKKVEEIAAVEGVDCLQMGPLDLSANMGYLWDPGNKKVKEVLYKVEKTVLASKGDVSDGSSSSGGAYLAGFARGEDTGEKLKERGYHMVAGAVDVALFRDAALRDIRKFRESGRTSPSEEDDDDDDKKDEKYWSE
ncbi:uncharacterized protein LOC116252160 [Nymphaea colorata]|uniref:HpcH/HpaI aldolase/citrate lyase domain-containing protein n=1 Tax=Nymphaea colorata TaxID=210225 RepID=A0A5K1CJG5_9MAGN|nr:uncharacterized protein LOC116252160 [Nymphaea colorata]